MTPAIRASVAVFCGSRPGRDPQAAALAEALGTRLGAGGHCLIYGAGSRGIMGVLAGAALAAGGRVIGVIPEFLRQAEVAHPGLNELIVTSSMHERKERMFALADLFVALPGGIGTLDETIEMITWRQLGLHGKPIYICNDHGWARGFRAALEAACEDGFADPPERLVEFVSLAELFARLDQGR